MNAVLPQSTNTPRNNGIKDMVRILYLFFRLLKII